MINDYIIQHKIQFALDENHEAIRQRLIHDYNQYNEIKNDLDNTFDTMILKNIIDNIYKTLQKNGIKLELDTLYFDDLEF